YSGAADLVDDTLAGVDFVRWGGDATAPTAPGAWTESVTLPTPANDVESLSRSSAFDTDDAADFCRTSASPGAANDPCPPPPAPIAAGAVLITEVDTGDFVGAPDAMELFNTTGAAVELGGAVLVVEDEGAFTMEPLPIYSLAAGARVYVTDNQGAPGPDRIVLGDNILWADFTAAMSVELRDGLGNGVDFVRFGTSTATPAAPTGWTGATVPVPGQNGSATRVPDAADTDSAADWCAGVDSPAAANQCALLAADVTVVINELNTGAPDWLEIANLGATDVDLGGWTLELTNGALFAGGPQDYVFPSLFIPAGGLVVVADGDPGVPYVETTFFNINWGGMSGNAGSAALIDPAGDGEDFVRFGGNGTAPPMGTGWTEAAALGVVADPDVLSRTISAGGSPVDSDDAADWCVLTTNTIGAPNPVCP
ncbi:MAG TPA: lamin tail domain-containing protein, partial [Myxococcota bacterium]|nr:lamin tail domain-containing protein [Myxococcota bacterium]